MNYQDHSNDLKSGFFSKSLFVQKNYPHLHFPCHYLFFALHFTSNFSRFWAPHVFYANHETKNCADFGLIVKAVWGFIGSKNRHANFINRITWTRRYHCFPSFRSFKFHSSPCQLGLKLSRQTTFTKPLTILRIPSENGSELRRGG